VAERGRPLLPEGGACDALVQVRVSQAFLAACHECARAERVAFADWVRKTLQTGVEISGDIVAEAEEDRAAPGSER